MKSSRRVLSLSVLAAVTLLTPISALAADTSPPSFRAGVVASLPNLGYESWGSGQAPSLAHGDLRPQDRPTISLDSATYWSSNGHYYAYVNCGCQWANAYEEARRTFFRGSQGYLVTITSLEEQSFIDALGHAEYYIGAADHPDYILNPTTDQPVFQYLYPYNDVANRHQVNTDPAASYGHYYWVSGPETGTKIGIANPRGAGHASTFTSEPGAYSNFLKGASPDDAWSGQDFVYQYGGGYWDDTTALANEPHGYIVEFDAPTSAPQLSNPIWTTGSQLTWNWSPPTSGAQAVIGYVWSGACSGSGSVYHVTCSGLQPGSSYSLTVAAVTTEGSGPTATTRGTASQGRLHAVKIARSPSDYCALMSDATVQCWGPNGSGVLSNPPALTGVKDIAGTNSGFCAVLDNGTVTCWGNNALNVLYPPTSITGAVSIDAWNVYYCVLLNTGNPYCWGYWDSSLQNAPSPGDFIYVAAGRAEACGIHSNGNLTCWSNNRVFDIPGTYTSVSVGEGWECGVTTSGAVTCFGDYGGNASLGTLPSSNAVSVSVGSDKICWVLNDGTGSCLGLTLDTPIVDAISVVVGDASACFLTANGFVRCAGGATVAQIPSALQPVVANELITSAPTAPTVDGPANGTPGQLTWTWSPNADGGSAITTYSWTGACSGSGLVTSVTCSGLTGGTNYTLNVTATNAVGVSAAGSRSGIALSVPRPPLINASAANGSLVVTWSAPSSNGGTVITGYTATATASGRSYSCTSTTLKCTITGLTNGTTYSLSVIATNAIGSSAPSNSVTIFPAPDTKFLAYSPKSVIMVKSNFQVLVANAKVGALVTVTAGGATKTCTANAVGECAVTLNSAISAGWVIVASYVDGRKTVSTASSYRVNIANITVSSVQVAKGKSFTVKISSGAPNTKFQVVTSMGTSYSVTLTGSGAGTITVATKSKGPLTLAISDNGILLQTTTVAVV